MARIKFVLNERRLALLEARRRVAKGVQQGESTSSSQEASIIDSEESMYEDEKRAA